MTTSSLLNSRTASDFKSARTIFSFCESSKYSFFRNPAFGMATFSLTTLTVLPRWMKNSFNWLVRWVFPLDGYPVITINGILEKIIYAFAIGHRPTQLNCLTADNVLQTQMYEQLSAFVIWHFEWQLLCCESAVKFCMCSYNQLVRTRSQYRKFLNSNFRCSVKTVKHKGLLTEKIDHHQLCWKSQLKL